jgi:hypothetical protein
MKELKKISDSQHDGAETVSPVAAQVDKLDNLSTVEPDNVNLRKLDWNSSAVPSHPKEHSPPSTDLPKPISPPGVSNLVSAPLIPLDIDKEDDFHPATPVKVDREPATPVFSNGATVKPSKDRVQNQSRSLPGSPTLRPVPHDRKMSPLPNGTFFAPPVSQAEQDWTDQKKVNNESNEFLDQLMEYQGLEAVKQKFLDIKSRVHVCRRQGVNLKTERFNIVFQGNPGTGEDIFKLAPNR